jgi:hypothetical protein
MWACGSGLESGTLQMLQGLGAYATASARHCYTGTKISSGYLSRQQSEPNLKNAQTRNFVRLPRAIWYVRLYPRAKWRTEKWSSRLRNELHPRRVAQWMCLLLFHHFQTCLRSVEASSVDHGLVTIRTKVAGDSKSAFPRLCYSITIRLNRLHLHFFSFGVDTVYKVYL